MASGSIAESLPTTVPFKASSSTDAPDRLTPVGALFVPPPPGGVTVSSTSSIVTVKPALTKLPAGSLAFTSIPRVLFVS